MKRKTKKIKQPRLHTAVFEGKTYFPIDMLRYDSCWPGSEEDSQIVNQTFDIDIRRDIFNSGEVFRVRVIGLNKFRTDRWKSFGWECVGLGVIL